MTRILAVGVLTGMRSMSGAATLFARHHSVLAPATAVLAVGEMIADKTPFVGNRTDALPQAGRAVMGAMVGGFVAREEGAAMWLGATIGAAAAVAATHVAYRLRMKLPQATVAAGLIEDALVIGAGALYAGRGGARRQASNA
jgi:uncharacterized membrane protein